MARLTTSQSITTQQVLDNTRFLSSQNLRSVQTKLTAAKGELIKLADTAVYSHLLSEKEKELLRSAAGIVGAVNLRVATAKEKKQRDEKQRQANLDARAKSALRIAKNAFTLPTGSTAECIEVVRVALILNQLQVMKGFYPAEEFSAKLIAQSRQAPSAWKTAEASLQYAIEILRSVQDYIVYELDDCDVQAGFDSLVARVAEARPRVIEQRAAVLHVWLDALESCGREVRA
ncbi:hypothetical protein BN1049_01340 [Pseudomonas saudimassiliensis]|uniref:Uncharacterized protein n=1 Tax=Pseudomonas saudimassiliensis TaxID=1461581 RepID=A0A078MCZ2_9PSED|nr:hypothetical protein [Pseudomonas saudimassiliensis]CEA04079.1 hypothetical protein BN1049_01340 [Pseudomonas saudimassiliensis]CEF26411.1 hypothetical protein BN1049_01340 [Pseudomonas saudimassiliensis]